MRLLSLFLYVASYLAAQESHEQKADKSNPLAGQPAAIAAGKTLFTDACGACHGANGEGGRGPNLAESGEVRRASDQQLFLTIQKGVPGSDMPPFPLPEQQIWQLVAFVRSLSAPAFESNVPGNAEAGSAIFFGKGGCSACHMIQGRGGFLGPDLSNIGTARPLRHLRESIIAPSARLTEGFQGVELTTVNGEIIKGVVKNHTNYSIQVLDAKGDLHLLPTTEVREVVFHRKSLMPKDYNQRLTASELENVLAFLSRQSLRPESEIAKARKQSKRRRR